MGNAFLYGNNNSGLSDMKPVVEIVDLTKRQITVTVDTLMKSEADPNNFIIKDRDNIIPISSVMITDNLKAKCNYSIVLEPGDHIISIKIKGSAFENKKPNTKPISKQLFVSNELSKETEYIEPLGASRMKLAATHVGNYAIFAGGLQGTVSSSNTVKHNTVEAYDSTLEKITISPLSIGRYSLAATHVGDYAIFAGGTGNGVSTVVDAYNSTLEKITISPLSVGRYDFAATHVGDYAIFSSHNSVGNGDADKTIDVYNSYLMRGSLIDTDSTGATSATHVGDYALFQSTNKLIIFNPQLTYGINRISTHATIGHGAATHVGDYAIFAGGLISGPSCIDTVNIYDSNLSLCRQTTLSVARCYLAATHVGDYAIFSGGAEHTGTGTSTSNYKKCAVVDVFDTDLIHTIQDDLHVARMYLAAAHVGNYAIFAGGSGTISESTVNNSIDAYYT